MKNIVLLTLLFLFASMGCKAQNENCESGVCGSGSPGSLRLNLELNTFASFRHKGMTMHGYNFDVGISLYKNLYALGSIELVSHHLRNDDGKTYFNSTGLSGGLVYNIIDRDNTTIPLKVKMGGTLGNPDWKYTFYDLSLALNQRLGKSNFAGVAGIGYRYEYSRVEAMSSHGFVYVFFGIKI